jgi:hypothetical protein
MTEVHQIGLRFASGAADVYDLKSEISAILAELGDPATEVARSASAFGLDISEFRAAQVDVSKEAKGFGDIALLILITAPAATHVLNKAWDDIIWPRIKARLGADALGRRDRGEERSEASDETDE